jgi:hypothetical protein
LECILEEAQQKMLGILGSKGLMMDLHRMNVHIFFKQATVKKKEL